MLANWVNVARLCRIVSPFRKASAQASYRRALLLLLDSQPSLASCPQRRQRAECSRSHSSTACPWLFRSTSTGAPLYQQAVATVLDHLKRDEEQLASLMTERFHVIPRVEVVVVGAGRAA
jgi:hypothetical protein